MEAVTVTPTTDTGPLSAVHAARQHVEALEAQLAAARAHRAATCKAAADANVPITHIATAANVTRTRVYQWLEA